MRDQLAGKGSRSMIASAVETSKIGFLLLARRRKTELRRPAISRDGSSPSNGNVFNLGNTRTSSDGSSAWTIPPIRSARFSFSERNTNPSRPDFFHCSRRWSANMPSGEDVEIAELAVFRPFLVALLLVALRALTFLLFFTGLPSSFDNSGAANRRQIQVIHFVRFPDGGARPGASRSSRRDSSRSMTVAIEIGRTATSPTQPARPHSQIL